MSGKILFHTYLFRVTYHEFVIKSVINMKLFLTIPALLLLIVTNILLNKYAAGYLTTLLKEYRKVNRIIIIV